MPSGLSLPQAKQRLMGMEMVLVPWPWAEVFLRMSWKRDCSNCLTKRSRAEGEGALLHPIIWATVGIPRCARNDNSRASNSFHPHKLRHSLIFHRLAIMQHAQAAIRAQKFVVLQQVQRMSRAT